MTDYCTKTADEAEFNAVMLGCGLCVETQDMDGNPVILPASQYVCIDRIGPILSQNGTYYPEFYANVRLLQEPTPEQDAALGAISLEPGTPQYRVWA